MRRSIVLVVFAALTLLVAGNVATANEHDHDHELPEHPHVLVLGVEIDGPWPPNPEVGPTSLEFRKCVDLAANQALRLGSQHHNVHFGTANQMLITKAGHLIAPTAPFPMVPWTDCESFAAFWNSD